MRKTILLFQLLIISLLSSARAEDFDADKAFASSYRILCDLGKKGTSLGSGFLINSAGYVGTNHHVIEGALEVYVLQRQGETIKVWTAHIHSKHQDQDLALLKVKGITGKPVVFTNERPKIAADVVAVGFPAQADEKTEQQNFYRALSKNNFRDLPADPSYNNFVSASVRSGDIESIRTRPWGHRNQPAMVITHDANITGGNSGGPLFLENGYFIGVNTAGRGEGNSNGVLIGNIMRMSSLYTELTAVLDRMDISYHVKGESDPQSPTPPADDVDPPSEPASTDQPEPKKEKKTEKKKSDDIVTMLEDHAGYIAIGLGSLVACLALYFGLRKSSGEAASYPISNPQVQPNPQGQQPPVSPPAQNYPKPQRDSVPITPVQRPAASPASTAAKHPACTIQSTSDSPVQVTFQIGANEIPPKGFILGRESSVSGRIQHSSVSRRHAKIKTSDGSLYVSDAGSSNGTIVGRKKLEPKTGVILRTGDIIKLGDVSLKVTVRS